MTEPKLMTEPERVAKPRPWPGRGGAPCRTRLREWRAQVLAGAGFDAGLAAELARWDEGLDFHALLTLVDAGCPPRLAARILEPWQPQR